MELVFPLLLGFIVGLSGAMMPGPLLVYTVTQSLRKGWTTGIRVIAGHAVVEVFIIALMVAGVSHLMGSPVFIRSIAGIGALFMAYMAFSLARSHLTDRGSGQEARHGTVWGGMMFTAFNPGFPLWWATAGSALLVEGMKYGGLRGAALVVIGHWGADLGYYTMISILVSKGRESLLKRHEMQIKTALAGSLLLIGGYFAYIAASG